MMRPQFSLAALLGVLALCGVLFGLLATLDTTYRLAIRCRALPPSDEELVKWFRSQRGVKEVATVREGGTAGDGGTVIVTFKKAFGFFEPELPPLRELGYADVTGMSSTASLPSTFPTWLWPAIAAAAAATLIAHALRSRKAKEQ